MGKSTKKIKSERINVLRKQYDSFLEEDKRRRDRNEYILEQIEKMRTNSALVPVRYKENPTRNDYNYAMPKVPEYQNKLQSTADDKRLISNQNVMLKPYVNNLEEPSVLNDIRKKYILIPRLQPAIQNIITNFEPYCDNPITDTDWKSKYNILNELKSNEKEPPAEKNFMTSNKEQNKDTMSYTKPSETNRTIFNNERDAFISNVQHNEKKHKDYDVPSTLTDLNKDNIEKTEIIDNNMKEYKPSKNDEDIEKMVDIPNAIVKKPFNENVFEVDNLNDQKLDENESKLNNGNDYHSSNQNGFTIENTKNGDNLNENHNKNSFNEDGRIQINELVIENTTIPDTHLQNSINKEKSVEENYQRETINDDKAYSEVNEKLTNSGNISKTEEIQEQEKYNENELTYTETEQEYSQNHSNNEQNFEEKVEFEPEPKDMYAEEEKVYEYNEGKSAEYPAENENYTNEQYAYYDEAQQEQPYTEEMTGQQEQPYTEEMTGQQEQPYTEEMTGQHEQPYTEEMTGQQEQPYTEEMTGQHEQPYTEEMTGQQESTEHYDQNYQQYANDYVDPNLTEYQDQQYIDNSYEQQQQRDFTNVNYEGVVDNTNYDYVNSDNVEVTNQDQPENVYNYENHDTQENIVYENQQYEENHQNEYPTIPNEQVQYEEPQNYNNYIEPHAIPVTQQPEVHGYEENKPKIAETNVENVHIPEE